MLGWLDAMVLSQSLEVFLKPRRNVVKNQWFYVIVMSQSKKQCVVVFEAIYL